jgi:cytochrome P450
VPNQGSNETAAIGLFGPNVLTAQGAVWRRHRKVTSPPFTERNLSLVFQTSVAQARDMLSMWRRQNGAPKDWISVHTFLKDMKTVATNVFAVAALGIHPEAAPKVGGKYNILECVSGLTQNIRLMAVIGALPAWFLRIGPEIFRERLEMRETLRRQFQSLLEHEELWTSKGSLLESFLKQRQMAATEEERFSDGEIMANLWIFNVAGHDTTSNTMDFLVLALAVHPEKQAWLRKELQAALPEDPEMWDYEPTMRAFTAAICVVFETLRMFPSQPNILRWTGELAPTIAGHTLPPKTAVLLSCTALHRNPKYWGESADEFIPERWDGRRDNDDGPDSTRRRFPTVRSPPAKGAFMPWSDGVRGCLGRKFSEIEMSAVIAVLFRDYEVEVERLPAESKEAAIERGWGSINSGTMKMAFAMREHVGLVWKKVGREA